MRSLGVHRRVTRAGRLVCSVPTVIASAGRSARRPAPWVLGVATVVALSGCSADSPAPAPAESAESTPASFHPGPLEELVGLVDSPESAQAYLADEARRESITAQCMADLGFDYEPIVTDQDSIVFSEGPRFGTSEYVEVYGYGVWNPPRDEGGSVSASYTDPNAERVEAMSEAERAAYTLAMEGEIITADDESVSYAGGGCRTASTVPTDDTGDFLSINEEAHRFLTGLPDDPAFSEVNAAWSACMSDAGYQEGSPITAHARVAEQFDARVVDGEDMPQDSALGAEEIRLATADLDCQEATGWRDKHTAIHHRLQQDYLDDHQAEFDELLAAVGAGDRSN